MAVLPNFLLCGGGFIEIVSGNKILLVKPAPTDTMRVNPLKSAVKNLQIYLLA